MSPATQALPLSSVAYLVETTAPDADASGVTMTGRAV